MDKPWHKQRIPNAFFRDEIERRFCALTSHVQEEIKSRFTSPYSLNIIEFGEHLDRVLLEEDIETFKNWKGG